MLHLYMYICKPHKDNGQFGDQAKEGVGPAGKQFYQGMCTD